MANIYIDSIYSVFPPLLAITLAIVSRRVLLSLGAGIVAGILLLSNFSPSEAVDLFVNKSTALVWSEGALNSWNLYLLGFLLLLGAVTGLISASGAADAFVDWAKKRIRTRRQAELMTILLGFVIFIDDYFNSLVVGSVAQPVADRYRISRAKLAYLLDSTASPVCVLVPVSSWGAYISAIIGGVVAVKSTELASGVSVLISLIPYNFYAILALCMLIVVTVWQLDIGPMKKEENRARQGELYNTKAGTPPGVNEELPHTVKGEVAGLFIPVVTLILVTTGLMLATGFLGNPEGTAVSLFTVLAHIDLGFSLFFGALSSLVAVWIMAWRAGLLFIEMGSIMKKGMMTMMPAVIVLMFAWMIASVINDLETGKYMASLALNSIPVFLLPLLLFVLTGCISFSTGSSWGTFGIMIPIAADMAAGGDQSQLLYFLAAVLSGAVFGDHCSPISDTTILSSTGAGCHHMDHVVTQLPYALMVAFLTAVGLLMMGLGHSLWLGWVVCLALFILLVVGLRKMSARDAEVASGDI